MVNIKGPRSALTDFIQEHNIKVKGKKEPNNEDSTKKTKKTVKRKIIKKNIKNSLPFENSNKVNVTREDLYLECESFDNLDEYAKYLSRTRQMTQAKFDEIYEMSVEEFIIYDCSMIKEYKVKNTIKKLILHNCGQLTENILSELLSNIPLLNHLTITGAYLISDFKLPKNLIYLDLTHCSRLEDKFLDRLYDIETLILSYCYGITANAKLNIRVKNLFLCETKINEDFFKYKKDVEKLSIKRCINIMPVSNRTNNDCNSGFRFIDEFSNLKYLDCEGISTIKKVNCDLKFLNASYCYDFKIDNHYNFQYLNLARVDISKDELRSLKKCEKLKVLNLSWNQELDDITFLELISVLNLDELYVFGCFGLSKNVGKMVCESSVKVIGCPIETVYLLEN